MGYSSDEKWGLIHGPLKTMIEAAMGAILAPASYLFRGKGKVIITSKDELKSNELKRLWATWDIAFDEWMAELNIKKYKDTGIYKKLVKFRNIVFTVIDNDGPYLKLVYRFIHVWERVKDDDSYTK